MFWVVNVFLFMADIVISNGFCTVSSQKELEVPTKTLWNSEALVDPIR